jgi:regulator of replication initiation timing
MPKNRNTPFSLADIVTASEGENFCQMFMDCLGDIFQYASGDVKDTLSKIDGSGLANVRKKLSETCSECFPQFKDRKVINRRDKQKVIADIVHLGSSVVNTIPTRELDKIFKDIDGQGDRSLGQPVDNDAESNIQEILRTVLDLNTRVTQLEKVSNELKLENEMLKACAVMKTVCEVVETQLVEPNPMNGGESSPRDNLSQGSKDTMDSHSDSSVDSSDELEGDSEGFTLPPNQIRKINRRNKSAIKSANVRVSANQRSGR